MPTVQSGGSREPAVAKPEVAAAEILAWVSDCIEGGLSLIARGILIFENAQFGELVETPADAGLSPSQPGGSLRSRLFADALTWNQRSLGTRRTTAYHLMDRDGHPLIYKCRFNVVPYHGDTGVLLVLQDVTERTILAHEASQVARFQSVLARIGS